MMSIMHCLKGGATLFLTILKKIGSWFEYEGNRLANGRDNFKNYLELHPELTEELEKKIVERLNSQGEK